MRRCADQGAQGGCLTVDCNSRFVCCILRRGALAVARRQNIACSAPSQLTDGLSQLRNPGAGFMWQFVLPSKA